MRMDARHPPAEVRLDAGMARRLLEEQHPRYLTTEPRLVDEGWDNFVFRVGDDYALKAPRREAAVALLLHEQMWLPRIATWLDLSVPEPVARGEPSALFPWPWSVVRWVPGRTAEEVSLTHADATRLAQALRSLHRPAPPEAPANPFRGVPLRKRRDSVEERLARLGLGVLLAPWTRALETELSRTPVWLHGDLHPRNVLVRDGALAGLIDWGDLTAGDPATDLACAWTLFDEGERRAFFEAYAPSEAERFRALGWAVNFASALLDSAEPRHVEMGRRIAKRLVAKP